MCLKLYDTHGLIALRKSGLRRVGEEREVWWRSRKCAEFIYHRSTTRACRRHFTARIQRQEFRSLHYRSKLLHMECCVTEDQRSTNLADSKMLHYVPDCRQTKAPPSHATTRCISNNCTPENLAMPAHLVSRRPLWLLPSALVD